MRVKKRTVSVMLASQVALGLVLTACSGTGTGPSPTAKVDDKSGPPTPINIFMDFTIAQPPGPDSPIQKEFEAKTNTKLNITWVNGPDFTQRLNVALASGELADLMKIDDVTNPVFQDMVKQGAFWDLTPFVKDYPNLQQYPKIIWDNTKINGKNYVIPVARPLDGFVFPSIRKDWLDKLGLKVPETMDDLYKVMKAFKDNAPDGKKDTYGYTMRAVDYVEYVFTGTNGKWKLKDGKLLDTTLEPEMKTYLTYMKKLYDEGLVPPDYSVMKDNQYWDLATGGRVGVTAETIEALWRWTYDQWKRDPKVEWLPLTSLSAGGAPFAPQYRAYIGVLAIPKKVPEAKLKKILSLLDYGASEEGGTLSLYGIKDVHYKVEDGFKVATEQAVKDSVGVGSFGKMFMRFDPYMYAVAPGMPKEVFERNKKIIDARSKISTPDPAVGLTSATNIKAGADYTKKIADLKVQVIMGKASMDAWDALVADLKKDAAYQKIIEEMNTAYQARKDGK
jgi:putative aldouronate transport system substrate-binding protein